MALAGVLALQLSSAIDTFCIMLSIGAGTGLLFMLRWFWWRINAAAELTAMIASFVMAILFLVLKNSDCGIQFNEWQAMIISVATSTFCWVLAAYIGPKTSKERLRSFVEAINPGGPGWKRVFDDAAAEGRPLKTAHAAQSIPLGILAAVVSCFAVYAALFATGEFIYSRTLRGTILAVAAVVAVLIVAHIWKKMNAMKKTATR